MLRQIIRIYPHFVLPNQSTSLDREGYRCLRLVLAIAYTANWDEDCYGTKHPTRREQASRD